MKTNSEGVLIAYCSIWEVHPEHYWDSPTDVFFCEGEGRQAILDKIKAKKCKVCGK